MRRSALDVVVGAVRQSRGVNGDGDFTDLLHPRWSGRGDQDVVVFAVQDLLVDALQPHRFGDVGLVVVVPAVGVPGQRGRLGQAAEGGEGRGRRGGRVGSGGRGAPASVRVTQDFTLAGACPQS